LKDPVRERQPAANPGAFSRFKTAARPRPRQFGVFCDRISLWAAARALSFSTFAPYIGRAGLPAMEIKCRRNKPFGPGGSTRRLHPSPPQAQVGFGGGETGSTRA